MAGTKQGGGLRIQGWGHHNLVVVRDYSTRTKTFRAETELRSTDMSEADFTRVEKLLDQGTLTEADKKEIVGILHRAVDALPIEPKGARNAEGKKRAKNIFSAAFGL
jgi:hypothetical protein